MFEPSQSVEIAARLPAGAANASITRVSCGPRACARAVAVAAWRDPRPVELVVAVDASPSTEGPARSRIASAVAALLATAPRGSRVRALAFGARALPIVEEPLAPDAVPLVPLAGAALFDLGAATRLAPAWQLAQPWLASHGPRRPVLVIVGDGGLTASPDGDDALDEARAAGVGVVALDLGDAPTRPELLAAVARARGLLVRAGGEAERAVRGGDAARLEERLAIAWAPVIIPDVVVRAGRTRVSLGPLRGGESLVWEGALDRHGRVVVSPSSLAAASRMDTTGTGLALGVRIAAVSAIEDPRRVLTAVDPEDVAATLAPLPAVATGPALRVSGLGGVLALARARRDGPIVRSVPIDEPGRGIPGETVLGMLRARVVPIARGCFRRDRGGRPDYAVRATFTFLLSEREVLAASVDGEIDAELRECLFDAVHALHVPYFEGRVLVRYPLHTAREARPATIDLVPEVAAEVDRVLAAP
jgi:Mg-chelatase subunit ChlD